MKLLKYPSRTRCSQFLSTLHTTGSKNNNATYRRLQCAMTVVVIYVWGCGAFSPNVGPIVDPNADAGDDSLSLPVDGEVSFARDIRPLFERVRGDPTGRGCGCHNTNQASHIGFDLSGFDTSSLKAIRRGGVVSGSTMIIPGKPNESELVRKLRGTSSYGTRMPKGGNPYWSEAEVKLVSDWIAQGAKGADNE